MKVERPKGTRDFPPDEMGVRDDVEAAIAQVFAEFGYKRIGTPLFELAETFDLKSGEEIREHMYVFEDKGGRRLCLRPEVTASVARMFSDSLRTSPRPLKLYYSGPMYRYEEPQKGRYREFWQMGVELLGPKNPLSDAEVVAVAFESLKRLGISFSLEVGHLGVLRGLLRDLKVSEEDQDKLIDLVDKGDSEKIKEIAASDTIEKLLKISGDKKTLKKAEKLIKDHGAALSALKDLSETLSHLDQLKIPYTVNLGIVRGLSYYTGMVFEVRVYGLGAQNQVCGGGRYDNLVGLFGGPDTPAVGFAFGFDRVVDALRFQGVELEGGRRPVVVAYVDDTVASDALKIAYNLRAELSVSGIPVELDLMGRRLGKMLEYADNVGAEYVVIVGPKELAEKKVCVRCLSDGVQNEVEASSVSEFLRKSLL